LGHLLAIVLSLSEIGERITINDRGVKFEIMAGIPTKNLFDTIALEKNLTII